MPRNAGPDCASGCHLSKLDRTNYTEQLIRDGKGLPVTNSLMGGSVGIYYLPYLAPASSGTPMSDGFSGGGVFCLTCHFAHGGPYYDALRWGYIASVSAGDQTGNVVPSNKGCQLCHNR